MLSEFALTPAIFDEGAHENKLDWLLQVKELGAGLFPRTGVCASLVADLYAGSWRHQASDAAKQIGDPRIAEHCKALLVQIDQILVQRPAVAEWPETDAAWATEAVGSNQVDPFDRIVAPKSTKVQMEEGAEHVRDLDEVLSAKFWSGMGPDRSPAMVVGEQVSLLGKLLAHLQWIRVINPYGCTSESRFCYTLLATAFGCNHLTQTRQAELHVQQPDTSDDVDRLARQVRLAEAAHRHLRDNTPDDFDVRLFFWRREQLRERRIIAGTYSRRLNSPELESVRWGLRTDHVAHETDKPEDNTDWSLLDRRSLLRWHEKYSRETADCPPEYRLKRSGIASPPADP